MIIFFKKILMVENIELKDLEAIVGEIESALTLAKLMSVLSTSISLRADRYFVIGKTYNIFEPMRKDIT